MSSTSRNTEAKTKHIKEKIQTCEKESQLRSGTHTQHTHTRARQQKQKKNKTNTHKEVIFHIKFNEKLKPQKQNKNTTNKEQTQQNKHMCNQPNEWPQPLAYSINSNFVIYPRGGVNKNLNWFRNDISSCHISMIHVNDIPP